MYVYVCVLIMCTSCSCMLFIIIIIINNNHTLIPLTRTDVYGDELTCDTFAQLEGENSEGVFFKYLEEAYDRWMKGDDDCASLEAKWARMFQQRNGEIQDEIDRLGADTEGMRKACSGLEAEVEHVAAQERLKANQASDVKKFRHLIDQFETLIGTIDSKTSQLSDEIATAERELQSKKDLRQQLQEKADQQRPVSVYT